MEDTPRNTEQFQILELVEALGQRHNFNINEASTPAVHGILNTIQRQLTPIARHGRRIEAMFGYVAAALGQCKLVKKEESGLTFVARTGIKIPDYRLVTADGTQYLVEVKNCHKIRPPMRFSLKQAYLKGLQRYATMVNVELKIAIYWSRWRFWTLISTDTLRCQRSLCETTFVESMTHNQVAILGDYIIGTTPPLLLRILTDPRKTRRVMDNGQVAFTIGAIQVRCGGKTVTRRNERNIVLYLMLYGRWPDEVKANIKNNQLISLEFESRPFQSAPRQGFDIVGYYSEMISNQYTEHTAPSGEVERLAPNVSPDALRVEIPTDYEGHQLPLWRFRQHPARRDQ